MVSSILNAENPGGDLESLVAGVRLLRVPLDELSYNPRNPRDEDIETDPETVELAASIALIGQQQPAVVIERELYLEKWPDLADSVPTAWVLMDGNRRHAAAKLNQAEDLECVTRDELAEHLDRLADLPFHANIHHKKINPLRLAYYLADKVKELGSQVAAAKAMGKSQPWVNHMLKLCQLDPALQKWVKAGEINARLGRELFKLGDEEQRRVALEVDELGDEEKRAEYWSAGTWKAYYPVIDAEGSSQADEGADSAEDGQAEEQPAVEAEKRPARPRPAIVIRVAERDPVALADELHKNLEADEFTSLVTELTRRAEQSLAEAGAAGAEQRTGES